ncbi:MAG TPA: VanZ family protein [Candidatus Acidoferrum sp.]
MPSNGRALVFLAVYVATVLYICLYPWEFNWSRHVYPLMWLPLNSRFEILDFVLNIVLYVPVGAAACLALRGRAAGLLFAIPLGFALSFGVEWTQRFDFLRVGNLDDLTSNTLGTALGAIITALAWKKLPRSDYGGGIVLAALWMVWNGFLLLPEFSHHALPREGSSVAWFSSINAFAGFLALSIAVRPHWVLPAILALAPIPALIGHPLALVERLLAGAAALALARLIRPRDARWLALALLLWLAFQEFEPFRFTASNDFQWLPFVSLFPSDAAVYYPIVFEKAFFYTAIVWMLRFQGASSQEASWIWAVAMPGVVLATGEAAQCWLPGRTPELTDLALVAGGAFLLWLADTPQAAAPRKYVVQKNASSALNRRGA